jgi:hypothetical protein
LHLNCFAANLHVHENQVDSLFIGRPPLATIFKETT